MKDVLNKEIKKNKEDKKEKMSEDMKYMRKSWEKLNIEIN